MKEKKPDYSSWVMIVGLVLIIIALGVLYISIKPAKDFCRSIDGNYSVSILKQEHFCNEEIIVEWEKRSYEGYKTGWDFEKDVDEIIEIEEENIQQIVINYEPPNLSNFNN